MLVVHREFFAKAHEEYPEDPLKSKYHESVLGAFQAALDIGAAMRFLGEHAPLSGMVCMAMHAMVRPSTLLTA